MERKFLIGSTGRAGMRHSESLERKVKEGSTTPKVADEESRS
jgi:hypothetical protein